MVDKRDSKMLKMSSLQCHWYKIGKARNRLEESIGKTYIWSRTHFQNIEITLRNHNLFVKCAMEMEKCTIYKMEQRFEEISSSKRYSVGNEDIKRYVASLGIQFSSVAQLCLTLCDPMNRSTSGLPDHHQLPEFTQTHIHWVGDAIQPSHPLSSPSPSAPNPSQNQGLFQWVNSSHEVAKYWSFSFSISPSNEHSGLISFRMDWLDLLAVQGTLKSLSNTAVQKHQFFSAQLSSQSNSHIHTWSLEKP